MGSECWTCPGLKPILTYYFSFSSVARCRLFYLPEPQFSHLLKGSIKIVHAEFSLASSKCLIKGSYCHIGQFKVSSRAKKWNWFMSCHICRLLTGFPSQASPDPSRCDAPHRTPPANLSSFQILQGHVTPHILPFACLFPWYRMFFP